LRKRDVMRYARGGNAQKDMRTPPDVHESAARHFRPPRHIPLRRQPQQSVLLSRNTRTA